VTMFRIVAALALAGAVLLTVGGALGYLVN
jgi:hypothetical protein